MRSVQTHGLRLKPLGRFALSEANLIFQLFHYTAIRLPYRVYSERRNAHFQARLTQAVYAFGVGFVRACVPRWLAFRLPLGLRSVASRLALLGFARLLERGRKTAFASRYNTPSKAFFCPPLVASLSVAFHLPFRLAFFGLSLAFYGLQGVKVYPYTFKASKGFK